MYVKLIAYALAAVMLFGAGWKTCSWKMGNTQKTEAIKQKDYQLSKINSQLQDVVDKSKTVAEQQQVQLDRLHAISIETTSYMESIATKSKQVENEIAKLGAPKCIYGTDYGRVWEQIGKDANAGRNRLYPAQSNP